MVGAEPTADFFAVPQIFGKSNDSFSPTRSYGAGNMCDNYLLSAWFLGAGFLKTFLRDFPQELIWQEVFIKIS